METTEKIETLALRLLDRYDEHISAELLLSRHDPDKGSVYTPSLRSYQPRSKEPSYKRERRSARFTALHGASFFGAVKLVAGVLEMKEWDVNARDCMGHTALMWAVIQGHEEVVNMLLEREDVNPDQPDTKYGRTPLSWAAREGHQGVVKILLERGDVNPDQHDTRYSRTPL